MDTKILLDVNFIFIFAGTFILVILYWLDSVRILRQSGFSRYKQKDDDDYVSGKKYNEHGGKKRGWSSGAIPKEISMIAA